MVSSPLFNRKVAFLGILLICLLSNVVPSYCGIEVTSGNPKRGSIQVGDTVAVQDPKFYNTGSNWVTANYIKYQNPINIVRFTFDSTLSLTLPDSFGVDLMVTVTYYDATNTSHSFLDTLHIQHNQLENRNHIYKSTLRFSGGYKVVVTVNNIVYQNTSLSPAVLFLEAQTEIERYYDLATTVLNPSHTYNATNRNWKINWPVLRGAEEYDLEWTYISDLDQRNYGGSIRYVSPDSLFFNFRFNSGRVTVSKNEYTINSLLEHGYLLYRVRGIGRWGTDYSIREEGAWSSSLVNGKVSQFADTIYINAGHEDSLNWQYTASYAEEGKRKEVVTYFDGTLRNRQAVTKLNSDQFTIVGETIYDHQGRGVVQVLPTPGLNTFISYNDNFNKNASSVAYNKLNFDTCRCSVPHSPDPISTLSGASNYYSQNNPNKTLAPYAYIPDAGGFPFTQVEYTPDNTGRISRQSGVGKYHYLGSGKETQYYYGTPAQVQLDVLFGSEAGYKDHYKKTMVKDANGQLSISYLDMSGRTIATSLAGSTPDSLKALSSNLDKIALKENLLANDSIKKNNEHILISASEILVASPDDHYFSYHLDPLTFNDVSCSGINYCFGDIFDLRFRISDACGTAVFDSIFVNVQPSSSQCSTQAFNYSFSKYLEVGNYTVTKELIVREDIIANHVDSFIKINTCLIPLQDFIDEEIAKVDTSKCACTTCLKTSRQYTPCEIARHDMLADVSPGGQYGQYLDPTGKIHPQYYEYSVMNDSANNILPNGGYPSSWRYPNPPYKDLYGNLDTIEWEGQKYLPQNVPDFKIFFANWKSSYANSLLYMHPEYCNLEFCESTLISSYCYDTLIKGINTYAAANTAGYINAQGILEKDSFFMSNATAWNQMEDSILTNKSKDNSNYSMKDIAVATWNCQDENSTEFLLNNCINNHTFGANPATKDEEWQTYRALYLSVKQNFIEKAYKENSCNIQYIDGKRKRFAFREDFIPTNTDGYPDAEKSKIFGDSLIHSYCDSVCTHNAEKWMRELEGCNMTQAQKDSIRKGFIEVSSYSCKNYLYENPWGATTLPKGETTINGYTSFHDVLEKFLGADYQSKLCNINLINMPKPFKHNYQTFDNNRVDSTEFDTCVINYLKNACYRYSLPDTIVNVCRMTKEASYMYKLLNELVLPGAGYKLLDEYVALNGATGSYNTNFDTVLRKYLAKPSYMQYLKSVVSGNVYTGTIRVRGDQDENHYCTVNIQSAPGYTNINFNKIDSFRNYRQMPGNDYGMLVDVYFRDAFNNPVTPAVTAEITSSCYRFYGCQDSVKKTIKTLQKMNFTTFFNYIYDVNLTSYEIGILSKKAFCDSSINLRSLGVYVPKKMNCAGSNITSCLRCTNINTAVAEFDTIDTYNEDDKDSTYYKVALENYLNARFSYNLTYYDYKNFMDSCDAASQAEQDTMKLCWEGLFPRVKADTPACKRYLIDMATHNAQKRYEEYIDNKKLEYAHNFTQRALQAGQSEQFTMVYPNHEYHFTLYYYDQAGNLLKTVPPEGVHLLDTSQTAAAQLYRKDSTQSKVYPAHTFVTQYRYNSLNQVWWQKTPDAGQSNFYYDRLGRVAASQSARQKYDTLKLRYSYTLYDPIGRIKEVGMVQHDTALTDAITFNPPRFEAWLGYGTKREITRTYYDSTFNNTAVQQFAETKQENLRSRVVGSTFQENNGSSYQYATHYTYDIHGNVKSLLQENVGLAVLGHNYKRIDYDYDLISGKVNRVSYQRGKADSYYHRYEYDDDNRLTNVWTSRDSVNWDQDAKYFYYKHGPLLRTELGTYKVQGIDYAYTIQGWLKGVNSNTLRKDRDMGLDGHTTGLNTNFARDAFGYTLGYFGNDYKAIQGSQPFEAAYAGSTMNAAGPNLFNGNIRHMVTAIGKFMHTGTTTTRLPLARTFQYDQLNRLVEANSYFLSQTGVSNNTWNGNSLTTNFYNERFKYDANGNILGLYRKANTLNDGTTVMDSLSYSYYDGKNRLKRVRDSVPTAWYTDDIDNQSNAFNYSYDSSGNMIADASEQIAKIEWTYAGKLKSITRTSGSSKPALFYAYDASGQRTIKIVKPTADPLSWKYTYYVRDAQGNILGSYTRGMSNLGSGQIKDSMQLSSWDMYGSSRLGAVQSEKTLTRRIFNGSSNGTVITETSPVSIWNASIPARKHPHLLGVKRYELNNHLGNVLATISDRRVRSFDSTSFNYYWAADVRTANDYYSYGSQQAGRTFTKGLVTCMTPEHWDTTYQSQYFTVLQVGLLNSGETIDVLDPFGTHNLSNYDPGYSVQDYINDIINNGNNLTGYTFTQISSTEVSVSLDMTVAGFNCYDQVTYNVGSYYSYTEYISCNATVLYYPPSDCEEGYGKYEYGFNGKIKDNDIKGEDNSYDFEARIYDPRLGRWLTKDSKESKFPGISTYSFSFNNPNIFSDPDGQSGRLQIDYEGKTITFQTTIYLYGTDANKELETDLNNKLSNIKTSALVNTKSGETWTVNYKVQFKYVQDLTPEMTNGLSSAEDLPEDVKNKIGYQQGDNILEINNNKFKGKLNGGETTMVGGSIGSSMRDDNAIFEESFHMVGFDERHDGFNAGLYDGDFTGDPMGPGKLSHIDEVHFLDVLENGIKQQGFGNRSNKVSENIYLGESYRLDNTAGGRSFLSKENKARKAEAKEKVIIIDNKENKK